MDDDGGARACQSFRGGAADAGGGTGNDGLAAGQIDDHAVLSRLLVVRFNMGFLPFRRDRTALDPIACAMSLLAKTRFRSEEHTSELQSLMRISYAVFCLKKKKKKISNHKQQK